VLHIYSATIFNALIAPPNQQKSNKRNKNAAAPRIFLNVSNSLTL